MKPQPQGHVMDNPYHQEDSKPDAFFGEEGKISISIPGWGNMSYSSKEAFKQLPEASSWPKFSETGEYDHRELIDYISGGFIDLPSIPDYWITAILNTEFKGHSSIWYTEMKEIHGRRNWPWERTNIRKYSPYKSNSLKEKQYFRDELKDKPRERVAEVTKKKNSCHNCGPTDHYANNCPKKNKKVYAIEKVPEEESLTEDSESDSMGDAIIEQSEEGQDPRDEFMVEYQEEMALDIQDK
ncbi:hypothetical protein O181_013916 [Austropuccinia psidii MF-1]|uniref:CCHC-type domain-containing protein n=1 Tax=Austropuccinia psidii MF-1 TaxID=1389203 RepID=A0A9Q3C0S1_9BASI|nr:hypothetical protein [Austropuccinia psidii MF-1]